jgi:hypothetical protein
VAAGFGLSVMRIATGYRSQSRIIKKEVIKMTRENRLELLKKIGERAKLERSKCANKVKKC